MSDDEEYYDDDDDGGYDVSASVQYIRSQLDKSVKLADDFILAKLELHDWDEKKALKAIKNSLPKAPAGKAPANNSKTPVASSGNQGKSVATSSKNSTKSVSSSSTPGPKSTAASPTPAVRTSQTVEETGVNVESVFRKVEALQIDQSSSAAAAAGESSPELVVSDDESIPVSNVGVSGRGSSSRSIIDSGSKPELTMIVVGHVDAGKSTLVGNLLHKLGKVTQKTMHKNEKEAKSIGKGSFTLAWVMDERKAERERGVTIDIAERYN
jgi:elongation factor 1 alpha-like protein